LEPEGCVFCAIAAHWAPADVVYEDVDTIAFMDLHPMREGHTLVIPKRHARDAFDILPEDAAATARTAIRVARAMKRALGCDGVNIFQSNGRAAGQSVFHYHVHVLPRWEADGLIRLNRDPSAQVGDIGEVSQRIARAIDGGTPADRRSQGSELYEHPDR
jgi:histidine triad (HIT) family protein